MESATRLSVSNAISAGTCSFTLANTAFTVRNVNLDEDLSKKSHYTDHMKGHEGVRY